MFLKKDSKYGHFLCQYLHFSGLDRLTQPVSHGKIGKSDTKAMPEWVACRAIKNMIKKCLTESRLYFVFRAAHDKLLPCGIFKLHQKLILI